MMPAHALVTWHQGLGAAGALPPELSLIWGSGKRTDCKARAVQLALGCDCWGTEACYWSLEKGGLGAEKEPGRHFPLGAVKRCVHGSGRGQLGLAGESGQRQLPGQTFWALWARVCSRPDTDGRLGCVQGNC